MLYLRVFQSYFEADEEVVWLKRRELDLSLWDKFTSILLESSEEKKVICLLDDNYEFKSHRFRNIPFFSP